MPIQMTGPCYVSPCRTPFDLFIGLFIERGCCFCGRGVIGPVVTASQTTSFSTTVHPLPPRSISKRYVQTSPPFLDSPRFLPAYGPLLQQWGATLSQDSSPVIFQLPWFESFSCPVPGVELCLAVHRDALVSLPSGGGAWALVARTTHIG